MLKHSLLVNNKTQSIQSKIQSITSLFLAPLINEHRKSKKPAPVSCNLCSWLYFA